MGNRTNFALRATILAGALGVVFSQVFRVAVRYGGTTAGTAIVAILVAFVGWKVLAHRGAANKFQTLVTSAAKASDADQHADALRLSSQALELARQKNIRVHQWLPLALVIQSKARQGLGKNAEALESAARAFASICMVRDSDIQMKILDQLGWMLLDQGFNQRAIAILEAATGLGAQAGAHPLVTAARLERTAIAYFRVGVHANAISAFGQSIDLMTKEYGPDSLKLSSPYTNLGNAYKRSQNFRDAERCYREALRLQELKAAPDVENITINKMNLGVLCAETGRNEEAEQYYLEVLRIRIAALGRNHWRVGNTYNNLASCRRRVRDFDGAEQYVQQALEILEDRPESLSNVYETLSRIREEQGRIDEALSAIVRAREIQQGLPSPDLSEMAIFLEREASLASRRGDDDRAQHCRAQASKHRVALASVPPADRDLTNRGDSLRTLEQHLESSLEHVKSVRAT